MLKCAILCGIYAVRTRARCKIWAKGASPIAAESFTRASSLSPALRWPLLAPASRSYTRHGPPRTPALGVCRSQLELRRWLPAAARPRCWPRRAAASLALRRVPAHIAFPSMVHRGSSLRPHICVCSYDWSTIPCNMRSVCLYVNRIKYSR